MREKSVISFVTTNGGCYVCLRNNFTYLSSFARVFFCCCIVYSPLLHSRNYRLNRNENFCKETQVSNIIAVAKVGVHALLEKKSTGFSCMSVTAFLLCFGCFAAGQHVDGGFFPNIDVFFC